MMIKFENCITPSPEQWRSLILGTRNAMNSWEKSDSGYCFLTGLPGLMGCHTCKENRNNCKKHKTEKDYIIGLNDLDLMKRLRNAGTDHRKFMRMITVYVDILAPLYWWKEFDTYKVGTVANSCSTMHKIAEKEFTLEDFSCEHLIEDEPVPCKIVSPMQALKVQIEILNTYRNMYLETKDKKYWWQMIQLLPSSYNQKRTVMMNYEVLSNMYHSRKNHKLDEWRVLCEWIKTLPYSEIITGEE